MRSQLGEGTTFILHLPALPVETEETAPSEKRLPMHGHQETVLVVEDEKATRDAVCEILAALNYRVLVANNGRDALDLLEGEAAPVDLVLSDMIMPEMGGVDLYKELQWKHPGLRMVLMTGYPLGTETRTLLDQERVIWVQKPLNSEDLARTVRKALEGLPAA